MTMDYDQGPRTDGRTTGSAVGRARCARARRAGDDPARRFVPAAHRALAYADVARCRWATAKHDEAGGRRPHAAVDRRAGRRGRAGDRHRQRLPHRLPGRLAREVHSIDLHADLADPRARAPAMGLGQPTCASRPPMPSPDNRPPLRCHLRHRRRRRVPGALPALAAPGRPPVRRPRPLPGDGSGDRPQRRQRSPHRIVVRNRPALSRRRGARAAFEF